MLYPWSISTPFAPARKKAAFLLKHDAAADFAQNFCRCDPCFARGLFGHQDHTQSEIRCASVTTTRLSSTAMMTQCLCPYIARRGVAWARVGRARDASFPAQMISFDDVTGTGRSRITFDRVPLDKALAYAAEDADFALRLWFALKRALSPSISFPSMNTLAFNVSVMRRQETTGILVDRAVLKTQSIGKLPSVSKFLEKRHSRAGRAIPLMSLRPAAW